MSKGKTEYEIMLNADDLYDSIEAARSEGAEDLHLEITFHLVNKKPEIVRKRLTGEINQEYSETL
jgi:hypothetical protein